MIVVSQWHATVRFSKVVGRILAVTNILGLIVLQRASAAILMSIYCDLGYKKELQKALI